MRRGMRLACMLLGVCLLAGCGSRQEQEAKSGAQKEEVQVVTGTTKSDNQTGQGFTPPKGSVVNKKGQIVDPEGNTYEADGSWAVPEGGHVDSKGRIIDADGNVMGGGAAVGTQG